MTPDELATCYVPLPLAWRHVTPGDVIVGKGGHTWHIERPLPDLLMRRGANWWPRTEEDKRLLPDPDAQVQVLTPVPMAQAMALTKAELGAQLLAVRTNAGGVAA